MTLVNTGLGGYPAVHSLVIDPRTPTTLYAGTEDNGVFRSTDSGGHWTAINDGLPGESYWGLVRSLVVDPKTPTTLYLGTNYYGVFKSTDSGGHWTPANVGLGPYPIIAALAIDITRGDLEEVYSLRRLMEPLAVQLAIEHAEPAQLDAMQAVVDQMIEATRRGISGGG